MAARLNLTTKEGEAEGGGGGGGGGEGVRGIEKTPCFPQQ